MNLLYHYNFILKIYLQREVRIENMHYVVYIT